MFNSTPAVRYLLQFVLTTCLACIVSPALAAQNLAPPTFSHESGFYPDEFELILSHDSDNVTIYYTLDGSDPDPDNLNGKTFRYKNRYTEPPAMPVDEFLYQEYKTYKYENPIKIVDRTREPDRLSHISTTYDESPEYFPTPQLADTFSNQVKLAVNAAIMSINKGINKLARHIQKYILGNKDAKTGKKLYINPLNLEYLDIYLFKGTPVKAIAVKGSQHSHATSRVLFIGNQDDFSLPIINITVPEKDLYDYEEGVFVAGIDYDNYLLSEERIPGAKHHSPANWKRRGENISAYIYTSNNVYPEGDIDIRVHGDGSRAKRNKSVRFYPEHEFDVFEDGLASAKHKIILRNSGNGSSARTYFTDAALTNALSDLNVGVQRYKPYTIFINGEYHGILNARDRIKKHYFSLYFDLPDNKVDYLERRNTAKTGDSVAWDSFMEELGKADPQDAGFYDLVEEKISLESYNDYHIIEIFLANTDWPSKNNGFWRYRETDKTSPLSANSFTDGRWRWLLFDVDNTGSDWGDYLPEKNMLVFATEEGNTAWPNPDWSTYVLRTLLQNSQIRSEFITRFADLLNTSLDSERLVKIVRATEASLEQEMPRHIARWSSPESMPTWRESVDELADFLEQRPKHQWQHLQDFFELSDTYTIQVETSLPDSGQIQLNTLTLADTAPPFALPWQGHYFRHMPITLEARPEAGYVFSHWQVKGIQLDDTQARNKRLVLTPENNLQVKAILRRAEAPDVPATHQAK